MATGSVHYPRAVGEANHKKESIALAFVSLMALCSAGT